MFIDRIELENFKNYKKLDLSLNKGVNLFVGVNGSGKTALLEGINVALGGFFGNQEQKMQRTINLSEVSINLINKIPSRAEKTSVKASSSIIGKWTRNFNAITQKNDNKYIKPASDYGTKIFKSFSQEGNTTIAPLIAYYSTQRLFKDAAQSAKQKFDPLLGRRNGYLQCLNDNAIKGTLVEWLKNAETSQATKYRKGINDTDLILQNVEQAIKKTLVLFMNDVKEEDIKLYTEAKFGFELFVELNQQTSLPINYYSDGFRNILYLVMDLIWRASQLNPWLSLEDLSKQMIGAVTIDEIDLHLHPKWQPKAISILQELLPNVQFFITTHSPSVLANFQHGSLFIIADGTVEPYNSRFFGQEIGAVLRNVLGAPDRHQPTQKKINELLRLVDEAKVITPEIEQKLEYLTDLLGNADPEVQQLLFMVDDLKEG